LNSYVGTYESKLYGKVDVSAGPGNTIHLRVNDGVLDVSFPHWHYDTFRGGIGQYGEYMTTVTFYLDNKGAPSKLELGGMPFHRVAPGR
jgi:hypothetical protein